MTLDQPGEVAPEVREYYVHLARVCADVLATVRRDFGDPPPHRVLEDLIDEVARRAGEPERIGREMRIIVEALLAPNRKTN